MNDKQVVRHVGDYVALRKKGYPPLEEFVDAFYWSQRGNLEPMQQYLAKIDEIKAKIPKLKIERGPK